MNPQTRVVDLERRLDTQERAEGRQWDAIQSNREGLVAVDERQKAQGDDVSEIKEDLKEMKGDVKRILFAFITGTISIIVVLIGAIVAHTFG